MEFVNSFQCNNDHQRSDYKSLKGYKLEFHNFFKKGSLKFKNSSQKLKIHTEYVNKSEKISNFKGRLLE